MLLAIIILLQIIVYKVFYFCAPTSLVSLSFLLLLNFYSLLSKLLSQTPTEAQNAGCHRVKCFDRYLLTSRAVLGRSSLVCYLLTSGAARREYAKRPARQKNPSTRLPAASSPHFPMCRSAASSLHFPTRRPTASPPPLSTFPLPHFTKRHRSLIVHKSVEHAPHVAMARAPTGIHSHPTSVPSSCVICNAIASSPVPCGRGRDMQVVFDLHRHRL
jgi:hypothetical protein